MVTVALFSVLKIRCFQFQKVHLIVSKSTNVLLLLVSKVQLMFCLVLKHHSLFPTLRILSAKSPPSRFRMLKSVNMVSLTSKKSIVFLLQKILNFKFRSSWLSTCPLFKMLYPISFPVFSVTKISKFQVSQFLIVNLSSLQVTTNFISCFFSSIIYKFQVTLITET